LDVAAEVDLVRTGAAWLEGIYLVTPKASSNGAVCINGSRREYNTSGGIR
jgi:hypothetical protein